MVKSVIYDTSDKDKVKFSQKIEVHQKHLVYCTYVATTNSFKHKCSDKNHLELTINFLFSYPFWKIFTCFSVNSLNFE